MNIILIEEGERHFSPLDERTIHIRKILHLKKGDTFKCGIINSFEGRATIEEDDESGLSFSFHGEKDTSGLYPVTLIVGQTRPISMRRILREAQSLGVGKIILPITDLGEKSYSSSSLYTSGEYKKILIDGAMQSGFTGVSECVCVRSLSEALSFSMADVSLLLDNVIGSENLSDLSLIGKSVTLAIGPERGWSGRERELLLSHGFKPVLIGRRILRTETAVPASVTLTLSQMGLI